MVVCTENNKKLTHDMQLCLAFKRNVVGFTVTVKCPDTAEPKRRRIGDRHLQRVKTHISTSLGWNLAFRNMSSSIVVWIEKDKKLSHISSNASNSAFL